MLGCHATCFTMHGVTRCDVPPCYYAVSVPLNSCPSSQHRKNYVTDVCSTSYLYTRGMLPYMLLCRFLFQRIIKSNYAVLEECMHKHKVSLPPSPPPPPPTPNSQQKIIKSVIDFTTDFKSIVKSTHDLTVKSSALDLRLILLSNQL